MKVGTPPVQGSPTAAHHQICQAAQPSAFAHWTGTPSGSSRANSRTNREGTCRPQGCRIHEAMPHLPCPCNTKTYFVVTQMASRPKPQATPARMDGAHHLPRRRALVVQGLDTSRTTRTLAPLPGPRHMARPPTHKARSICWMGIRSWHPTTTAVAKSGFSAYAYTPNPWGN